MSGKVDRLSGRLNAMTLRAEQAENWLQRERAETLERLKEMASQAGLVSDAHSRLVAELDARYEELRQKHNEVVVAHSAERLEMERQITALSSMVSAQTPAEDDDADDQGDEMSAHPSDALDR